MTAQSGLCRTWPETPKTGFLTSVKDLLEYCKVSKFSGARKLCCKLPKIQTKRQNHRIFCRKDANEIANSEDPDQTAPQGAVLIWVCTVCPDLSVRKLKSHYSMNFFIHTN